MTVSYDWFTDVFLDKITEYDFVYLAEEDRQAIVDGYMKRACSSFSEVCKQDIVNGDDENRVFTFKDSTTAGEIEEIIDIVTDGMLVQWLRPHLLNQENLRNQLNTLLCSVLQKYSIINTYRIAGTP